MKITITPACALLCLLSSAPCVSARNFTAPVHGSDPTKNHIKTAANFDSKGVKMEVCPSGDCKTGKFMQLTVTSLTELDSKGVKVESVTTFKPKDSDWTAIAEETVNGVSVSSTTFVSTVEVGTTKTPVGFNLTAKIFQGNATVLYGSQNLSVPAGSLKFTVDMGIWPFANLANTLSLAIKLDAKGPKGSDIGKPAKKLQASSGKNTTVQRVSMGDSMFMDAPSIVILDGVEKNVTNSSVVTVGADTFFEWVFPNFAKTLHYDPVLGDESVSTSTSTSNGSNTNSSSGSSNDGGTTPTPAPSSSAVTLSISSLAAAGFAVFAYILY
ncbi:uncharacterized protein PHALS_00962 [Plasmopara halstedii]|uniref:RxLR-like protein n=1 Tax=Plasmopara halstedii TaxID=4781 RepID=A0A0P1ATJ3_PLAHL|nr:uncharacterized protein PHALS_00962 [Plasmopara halstedii]CEG44615.1 hypothetical protein PHALS_00962 [Plasmopara halstedii]|eukprot:XP_024580984.1 hypothetical protein PHALS_00962 [Plasmopara halstedii]